MNLSAAPAFAEAGHMIRVVVCEEVHLTAAAEMVDEYTSVE